jgi:hypothetical protein
MNIDNNRRLTMLKKLMIALAVVAMAIPAFAAVESIQVGGDMDVKGMYRKSFEFDGDSDPWTFTYMSTRVWVKAELTDSITAMVRLINERDFGNDYLREIEGSVLLDLAYVKVANLMTPGLDLTVGRQEIKLGEGLVVGSRYRSMDYIGADIGTAAIDQGKQKAFDAIRVDYNFPMADLGLTAFKAKILETYGDIFGIGLPIEDLDLYGVAAKYNGEMFSLEPYVVYVRMEDAIDLYTWGARVGLSPMESLSFKAEFAKQFGDADLLGGADFSGWAVIVGADFAMDSEMAPTLSAAYNRFTGQDSATDIDAWIPVFPSDVASRVGKIAYPAVFGLGEGIFLSLPASGLQVFKLGGSIKPVESVMLGLNWFHLRGLETPVDEVLGNEVDFCINYQYTEDLSFGLDLGILFVGDMVDDVYVDAKNPWQLVGSMKVAF